jgi:HEPN domain-containing protein
MAEHYPNAAYRHLTDSKHLLDASSWDGSAYLAGYVIECSLKALISHSTTPPGIDLHAMGHDLSSLTKRLDQMASSRQSLWKRHVSAQWLSALRGRLDSSRPSWSPSMRYESRNPSWAVQADSWWKTANRCFEAFAKDLVTESCQ